VGLVQGDILIGWNKRPVSGIDDLHRALTEEQINRPATLTLLRGVDQISVPFVPTESL